MIKTCETCGKEYNQMYGEMRLCKECQKNRYIKDICPGCGRMKNRTSKLCFNCNQLSNLIKK